MDQKQFDAVLSDAEKRLRRLKVLYEQWFVGIERVEPAIPRKEVEDLLTRLRKEQVTNTAQRFRLQQLVQRHVSLSTHWRRIGRQIEEGTYQRDLQRAKRRMRKETAKDPNGPDADLAYDMDIDVDLTDVLAEADRAADAALEQRKHAISSPPMAATGQAVTPGLSSRTFEVDTGLAAAAAARVQPAPPEQAPAAKPEPAQAPPMAAAEAQPGRPLVRPPAAAGKPGVAPPAGMIAPPVARAGERRPAAPSPAPPAGGEPPSATMPAARAALRASERAADATEAGGEARRASAGPRGISPFALPSAGSIRPKPLTPPKAPPPPPVVAKAAGGASTQAAANQAVAAGTAQLGGSNGATAGRSAVARPAGVQAKPASAAQAGPSIPIGARPASPQAGATPVRRPEPAASPRPAAATRPANSNGPGSSAFDMERIYSQYLAAREQNRERTDNVKRDTLEKTLRSMLPQLEKKHAGKKIDFEVVVKDGKVALKPVAK